MIQMLVPESGFEVRFCRSCGREFRGKGERQWWCRARDCQAARFHDHIRANPSTVLHRHADLVERLFNEARQCREHDAAERKRARRVSRLRSAWLPNRGYVGMVYAPLHYDAELREYPGKTLRVSDTPAGGVSPGADDELMAAEVTTILGDLTVEDVARLDEHTLIQLRERLVAAGVVPRSVQDGERERLRDAVPHRGDAPFVKQQPMTPDHKHRKPRKGRGKGHPSSRKPRGGIVKGGAKRTRRVVAAL